MRTSVRRLIGVASAVIGLVVAQRVLNPAPIPAAGLLLGGLVVLLVSDRLRHIIIGATVGLLGGSCLHWYSHVAEGRVDSFARVSGHVFLDAAVGFIVGGCLLIVALAWDPSLFKSQPPGSPPGSGFQAP